MRLYNKDGIIYSDEMKVVDGKQKRIRKSLKIAYSKANVKKIEQALEKEHANLNYSKNFKTFEYIAEEYLLNLQAKGVVRDYTIKDYRSALEQHIYPFFRKKYIHEISILEIETLKNNLLMKYASTRVKNIFIPFKGAFKEAVRFSYISDNPFNKVEAIRKKKNENKKLRPFSKDEINFLIENATGSLKIFIALSFYLGTRPSELLALKWGDIYLKEQYVNITGAITGKQSEEEIDLTKSLSSRRQIYFPLIALKYFEFNNHDYVFVSQKNEPFTTTKSMSEKFRKLLKKTNLENHVLYDLRHSYASINLSENTMPIILISKQMGHKDSTVTLSVYADYIKNNVEETINIIDCAFRD